MPSTTKPLAAVTLAAAAVAVLAGCTNPLHPGAGASPSSTPTSSSPAPSTATPSASPSASSTQQAVLTAREQRACAAQATWNTQAKVSLKALYADTGALAADAHAGNLPGVRKAGSKLAADSVAAATLPLPAVAAAEWQTLTQAYATAGTALAGGGAVAAVPQLQAGGSALSAFTTAVAKCKSARS